MYILVADDEGPKLDNIVGYVRDLFPWASIGTSRSVRSTLEALRSARVDLLFLDMSLPTFDVAPGELGGRPQNYGGIEVLRYMDFYAIECPVIVITQYEAFAENGSHVSLPRIGERLASEHPKSFVDIIHYGGSSDPRWRKRLAEVTAQLQSRGI